MTYFGYYHWLLSIIDCSFSLREHLVREEATFHNVIILKSILWCFELTLGLKVSFQKSKLAGVGVDSDNL